MLAALGMPGAHVSVVLCDDRVMRRLNHEYRGIDGPTDVLAFATRDAKELVLPVHALGDIVISLDTAARQARASGWTLADEVATLLAHGLLHLLGFDHRDPDEERRMRARTDALRSVVRTEDRRRRSRRRRKIRGISGLPREKRRKKQG